MTLDKVIAVRTAKTVYRDGDLCIKVFNEEFSKASNRGKDRQNRLP